MTVSVALTRLPHGADLPLPAYQTDGAAGLDLMDAVSEPIDLRPGARRLIPTGIAIALPPGYEAQIRPRSGLAFKFGISIVNAPGTIDADYRGELSVLLINLGDQPFRIAHGDRIAQMVAAPVTRISWDEVASLEETDRGSGGYGSTGTGAHG